MCLILLACGVHPRYPLIVAANRDEFLDRPTAPARFWDEAPQVLAGRDLLRAGTWLGITTGGRFAALTNFRDPSLYHPEMPSRGMLVSDYLGGTVPAADYLAKLHAHDDAYNGYNLLCGTPGDLLYHGNRGSIPVRLTPGVHGLSNHLLDTPWPKVVRGKMMLERLVDGPGDPDPEALFRLLADRTLASEAELPETGVSREWELRLSSIFIEAPGYGTRSSTLLFVDRDGRVSFRERTYPVDGGEPVTATFSFAIS